VVQQYLDIRAENPGTLVLFQVGSFYEAWFDEAELLARELGLKLSSRPSGGTAAAVAQAGFALHALDGYLARLLQRGYRVAVVEEAAAGAAGAAGAAAAAGSESAGMRQRAVVRTLTPGTVTAAQWLPEDRPNYLCGVTRAGDIIGLAWTDVSTGEFHAGEYDADAAAAELARMAPAEVVLPVGVEWPEPVQRLLPDYAQTPATARMADAAAARAVLADAYASASPLDDLPVAQHAAGMVLGYLRALKGETAAAAEGLDAPTLAGGEALRLDPATRRHLELTETSRERAYQGTLLWAIDRTASAMGRRLLRSWLARPLVDLRPIQARQRIIAALVAAPDHRRALAQTVAALPDLERLAGALAGGRVSLDGLREVAAAGEALPDLAAVLSGSDARFLHTVAQVPPEVGSAITAIRATLAAPGSARPIRPTFSLAYDQAVRAVDEQRAALDQTVAELRRRTGIARLRLEQTAAQGWFLEVPANAPVPAGWLRKGGLAKVERYTTAEIEEQVARLVAATEALAALERQLLDALVRRVRPAGGPLRTLAQHLAAADALQALATIAAERGWVRPSVVESAVLAIRGGRHPVLEGILGEQFVPNDTQLVARGAHDQVMILTGPNMAGKSSLQRQVALLVLLAQAGSFVPAREATIGVVDGIYTRLGAADDLARGQSTFMVEMLETAQVLRAATDRSLCLFDELGRGTSTYDGMAIAWAVAEHLATGPARPRTIVATHYHELNALAAQLPQVRTMRMAVHEGQDGVRFLYRLEPGGADRSYGIAVAKMAGLPSAVLHRAEAIARAMEPATREGQRRLLESLRMVRRDNP
jgi:DNA mismatch repair protein MutS